MLFIARFLAFKNTTERVKVTRVRLAA